MRGLTWVMAGVGSLAVALLAATASAGGGGPVQGVSATYAGAVASIENAGLDQVGAPSCVAAAGVRPELRPGEGHDDLLRRLTDRLDYVEGVFANATPGSPAQFRAREEADSLREQLCSIGGGSPPRESPR